MEDNSDLKNRDESSQKNITDNKNIIKSKETNSDNEKNLNSDLNQQSTKKALKEEDNAKKNDTKISKEGNLKDKKEIPIEKKPFNEFINENLIPTIIQEFESRNLEVEEIFLRNTSRPIAGDKCWVIFCQIKSTCNFWLAFEKEDISSLKSISLSKANQKPSVIESFLIDEKRITLKLIISRILQRLNGQKLLGIN